MKFNKGQQVVCIDPSYRNYCAFPLRKGGIYSIHGFYQCPSCGSRQVTLMEVPGTVTMGCRCTRTSFRRQSYYLERFVPLQDPDMGRWIEEVQSVVKEATGPVPDVAVGCCPENALLEEPEVAGLQPAE
jgi:hypothetical protein